MIINLSISNWRSYQEETEFCLAGTEERRLTSRVPKVRNQPVLRVSPVAAVYGGNASGKSNLFQAIGFLQNLVLYPLPQKEQELPVGFFALSPGSSQSPTVIELSFLPADEKIYTLKVVVTPSAILEESLSLVRKSGPVLLYIRKGNVFKWHCTALSNDKNAKAYAQIISPNQLFFGMAGTKVTALQAAYDWFHSQLQLIGTTSEFRGYGSLFSSKPTDIRQLAILLNKMDTGICDLGTEETRWSALPQMPFSESEATKLIAENGTLEINQKGQRFIVKKKNNELEISKMISFHKNSQGKKIKFNLEQESEGTLRMLDILPAFVDLEHENSRKVYIIDELDRSWHYELTRRLLGIYLANCSEKSRTQLIFSTHDLLLMDQDLFRQDEMWITERDDCGKSSLFSLKGCGIRYDKDIRKAYLMGAYGGMPHINCYGSLLHELHSSAN